MRRAAAMPAEPAPTMMTSVAAGAGAGGVAATAGRAARAAEAARKDRRLIFAEALRGMVSGCLRRCRRLPECSVFRKRYA